MLITFRPEAWSCGLIEMRCRDYILEISGTTDIVVHANFRQQVAESSITNAWSLYFPLPPASAPRPRSASRCEQLIDTQLVPRPYEGQDTRGTGHSRDKRPRWIQVLPAHVRRVSRDNATPTSFPSICLSPSTALFLENIFELNTAVVIEVVVLEARIGRN